MDADRWQRISRLYHEALGRPVDERRAFLDVACSGDEALRAEIESLLTDNASAQAFRLTPAPDLEGDRFLPSSSTLDGGLEPGVNLGTYQIVRRLGRGGMALVFLAQDTTLHRRVALKVLDSPADGETARARLLREARNAAALNHPNVCTVYEVGKADGHAFIAMEYVDGRPLSDRLAEGALPLDEAVAYGIEAADALAHAHEHGVIHRDLKAANAMVTRAGRLKLVDFGLARREDVLLADATTMPSIAPAGVAVGTPYAMAPEQVRGAVTDVRTDIWALGVLLYEMVSGAKPFAAATLSELFSSILRDAPAPLPATIPPGIAAIIERCLLKDPEARFQSAADARAALANADRSAAAAAAPPRTAPRRRLPALAAAFGVVLVLAGGWYWYTALPSPLNSIVVLPFANVSGDPDVDYLSDGITDGLINSLGRVSQLNVTSRNAAFRFKGPDVDVQRAAQALNVRGAVTGRVTRRGDDLSISVELVDAADNRRIWGDSFNRKVGDLLTVQDEISTQISSALHLRLSGQEQQELTRRYTRNTSAHQLYLRGRYEWNKKTPDGFNQGIKLFNEAIDLDPNYAPAYAGLAAIYNNAANYNFSLFPPLEAYAQAKRNAERAIQIDDALASAHASLALVYYQWEWDWPAAEREFKRALDLGGESPSMYEPGPSSTNHWYAHLLMTMGRTEESQAAGRRALRLDPVDTAANAHQGWHYLMTGSYDEAVGPLLQAIQMFPAFSVTPWYLGMVYEQQGDLAKALEQFDRSVKLTSSLPSMVALRAHALAMDGRRAEAQAVLDHLLAQAKQRYVPPYPIAVIYTGLGNHESAFEWLEKAYAGKDSWLNYVALDPRLDPLRTDMRFADLLHRMKLTANR